MSATDHTLVLGLYLTALHQSTVTFVHRTLTVSLNIPQLEKWWLPATAVSDPQGHQELTPLKKGLPNNQLYENITIR